MTDAGNGKFFACCLSPHFLFAPEGRVLAEVTPEAMAQTTTKVTVVLPKLAYAKLQAIRLNPAIWASKGDDKGALGGAADDNDVADVGGGDSKVYASGDFTRSIAGGKNMEAFLASLVKVWADCGVPILDDEGRMMVNGNNEPYSHLCKRSPEYLDIKLKSETDRKAFGKSVVGIFSRLLPQGDLKEAKRRVKKFFDELDYLAQPVFLPQFL